MTQKTHDWVVFVTCVLAVTAATEGVGWSAGIIACTATAMHPDRQDDDDDDGKEDEPADPE